MWRLFIRRVVVFGLVALAMRSLSPIENSVAEEALPAWKLDVLQRIARYSAPGFGIDSQTYQPYDHVRINSMLNISTAKGLYTAASKNSVYLAFLLKIAISSSLNLDMLATEEELQAFKERGLALTSQNIALWRIWKNCEALRSFQEGKEVQQERGEIMSTGLFPWMVVTKKGTLVSDKDDVPVLDNAMLSWVLAAIVGQWADSEHFLAQKVARLAQDILSHQRYELFWDDQRKCVVGTFNERTQKKNQEYEIQNAWTEDLLVVLWMLAQRAIPQDQIKHIQQRMLKKLVAYETTKGDVIDVPQGYVQSAHEMGWGAQFLPYEDTRMKDMLYQMYYHQADYALAHHKLGFMAVAYDALGTYVKMGIPETSLHPDYVQRTDCSVIYATALGATLFPQEIEPWLKNLLTYDHVLNEYGAFESVGPEGVPDIMTADSQYNVALALLGGIRQEVKQYLKLVHNPAQEDSAYDQMVHFVNELCEESVADLPDQTQRFSKDTFPKPLLRYEAMPMSYGWQSSEFDLIPHFTVNPDDRHGAFVFAPEDARRHWDIEDGVLRIGYNIPENIEPERRFAWAGTYLGRQRPFLAGYDYVDITIPNDPTASVFEILFNRENTIIVQPIEVNPQFPGKISSDKKWKTLTYRLWHIDKYKNLPLTYVAVSVHDPYRHTLYKSSGEVVIQQIRFWSKQNKSVNLDEAIREHTLEMNADFNPKIPEFPEKGYAVRFQDSGALGQGTRGETKEENNRVYVEFEDVDLSKGFSGIWIQIDPTPVLAYDYMSFDILRSPYYDFPSDLKIELKKNNASGKTVQPEDIKKAPVWEYAVDVPKMDLKKNHRVRVFIPLNDCDVEDMDMLSFVHENWQTGQKKAAYIIANIAFYRRGDEALRPVPGQTVVQVLE